MDLFFLKQIDAIALGLFLRDLDRGFSKMKKCDILQIEQRAKWGEGEKNMYIADLHIHSKYSRATSRDLVPEQLEWQARQKGIQLLGTGDFTHPLWRKELKEKLTPAEEGLYRLKPEYSLNLEKRSESDQTRFVVTGEISSIYKQGGKVRKVHSLILLPSLEAADQVSAKLELIGNIHSDGRPILGLSCHDLLEIMLEVCPDGMLVPAHIWTPHFAMLGALSGFDTVEECFSDLTPYIHAVETGLSSDPLMNWRVSALDRFQLISNSDAHSPAKLGREANLFSGEMSYKNLKKAIETGMGLEGTIEFFPEEGKYHFDGHRKCNICLSPEEAERYAGICPVCKKKLTMGVSHRIAQLADRPEGFVPVHAKKFESLVPLPEVIAASIGGSSASKKVQGTYSNMLERLGSEFAILRELPLEEIQSKFGERITEGIRRLRMGKVIRLPGFDGEYGKIQLFDADEMVNVDGQMSFSELFEEIGFACDTETDKSLGDRRGYKIDVENKKNENTGIQEQKNDIEKDKEERKNDFLDGLNEEQKKAISSTARSIAVIAGPGTGKTKTLIARIRYLVEKRRVNASEITAVTFTNRAAEELKDRLEKEMPHRRTSRRIQAGTFHSLCHTLLKEAGNEVILVSEAMKEELAEEMIQRLGFDLSPTEFLKQVSRDKIKKVLKTQEKISSIEVKEEEKISEEEQMAINSYEKEMENQGYCDFDDLLIKALLLLREDNESVRSFCQHFKYLLVDEFQDISPLQYQLIQAWNQNGRELFIIGDPDQSIYGFRGSDPKCFEHLMEDFPDTEVIRLRENYRSTSQVIHSSCALISHNSGEERRLLSVSGHGLPIRILQTGSVRAEEIQAAREIRRMVGGIDMLDVQMHEGQIEEKMRSFSDIAVLCRTHRQAEAMEEYLKTEGIPYIITGRGTWLEKESVKELLEFFRSLFTREENAYGTCRYLEKRLGKDAVSLLQKKYGKLLKKKPAELIKDWIEDQGYVKEDALEKLESMALFHKTIEGFLEVLESGEEEELKRCGSKNYTADAVSLMTLHASKGLEFPAVILTGVRKYSIPLETRKKKEHRKWTENDIEDQENDISDIEEERRLFYVGMTRAKEELILMNSGEPSCFLEELSKEDVVYETVTRYEETKAEQLSLFDFM